MRKFIGFTDDEIIKGIFKAVILNGGGALSVGRVRNGACYNIVKGGSGRLFFLLLGQIFVSGVRINALAAEGYLDVNGEAEQIAEFFLDRFEKVIDNDVAFHLRHSAQRDRIVLKGDDRNLAEPQLDRLAAERFVKARFDLLPDSGNILKISK